MDDFHEASSDLHLVDAIYIGMELMDTDLQNILMQKQLSPAYVKLFLYQMLRGLKVGSACITYCFSNEEYETRASFLAKVIVP